MAYGLGIILNDIKTGELATLTGKVVNVISQLKRPNELEESAEVDRNLYLKDTTEEVKIFLLITENVPSKITDYLLSENMNSLFRVMWFSLKESTSEDVMQDRLKVWISGEADKIKIIKHTDTIPDLKEAFK